MTQKAWLHNNLGVSIADLEITDTKITIMTMEGAELIYIRCQTSPPAFVKPADAIQI